MDKKSLAYRDDKSSHKKNNLLISLGGVDEYNATNYIFQHIVNTKHFENWTVNIILGKNFKYSQSIEDTINSSKQKCQIFHDINDMAEKLSYTDLAIGAGGTSTWERCCLGVPTLFATIADNQRAISESIISAGAGLAFYDIQASNTLSALKFMEPKISYHKLKKMSLNARALVDGRGLNRVSTKIYEILQ